MPGKMLTPAEVEEWLGGGLVLFAPKPSSSSPQNSTAPAEADKPATSEAPLDLQNLPFDPARVAQEESDETLRKAGKVQ